MEQIPCPDGYLLSASSPLADAHHVLNTYLVQVEEKGWKAAIKNVNAIRDKRLKMRIWLALFDRLDWLYHNTTNETYARQLHDLTYSIEEWKLSPAEEELITALQRAGDLCGYVMPYTPTHHLMAYIKEHGHTKALADAIAGFDAKVRKSEFKINQTRLQLLNSRLDMLAWWNEWTPIDLKRCWSEQVRKEFREMQGSERESWRKLLHSIQGDEGVRPSASWMKHALSVAAETDVPARLKQWFAPLRKGEKIKLSREGSFLLRSFIFLAGELNDPDLKAMLADIAGVEFKPKANGSKVVRAASEAAGIAWQAPPPPPVPNFSNRVAKALGAVLIGPSPLSDPLFDMLRRTDEKKE